MDNNNNEKIETLETLDGPIVNNPEVIPKSEPQEANINTENTIVEYKEVNNGKNPFLNKVKTNYKKYLIIACGILLVAGVSVFYILVINNPKNVMSKAFDSILSYTTDMASFLDPASGVNIGNDPQKMYGHFEFNTNIEEYRPYSLYSLDYEFGIDIKNNQFYTDDTMYLEEEKLLSLLAVYQNNKVYLKLHDIYEKFMEIFEYKMDINEVLDFSNNSYSNEKLIKLVQIIKDYFFDGMDKNCIISNNKQMTINGGKLSVNEYAYKVSKRTLQNNVDYVIKKLLKDDEALNLMVDITGKEKTVIIDYIKTSKLNDISEESMSFILYTTGIKKEFVGITIKDSEYRDKFHYYVNNGKTSIFLEDQNNEDTFEIYKYISDGKDKIEIKENDTALYFITCDVLKKNEIKAEIKTLLGIELNLDYKYSVDNNKKNILFKIQINQGNNYLRFNLENTLEKVKDINFDTSTSVKYEEMDPKDIETIMNKLQVIADRFGFNLQNYFSATSVPIIEEPQIDIEEPEIVEFPEVESDLSIVTKDSYKQEVKDLLKATEDAYIRNRYNNRDIKCYYKILNSLGEIEYSRTDGQINVPDVTNKKGFYYSISITNYDEVTNTATFKFNISNGKYFAFGSNVHYYDDFTIFESSNNVSTTCS